MEQTSYWKYLSDALPRALGGIFSDLGQVDTAALIIGVAGSIIAILVGRIKKGKPREWVVAVKFRPWMPFGLALVLVFLNQLAIEQPRRMLNERAAQYSAATDSLCREIDYLSNRLEYSDWIVGKANWLSWDPNKFPGELGTDAWTMGWQICWFMVRAASGAPSASSVLPLATRETAYRQWEIEVEDSFFGTYGDALSILANQLEKEGIVHRELNPNMARGEVSIQKIEAIASALFEAGNESATIRAREATKNGTAKNPPAKP